MTNFEKHFDDLTASNFGLADGKIVSCTELSCYKCIFYRIPSCAIARMEWLKAEYEEPKITIPEGTPIDTKVIVSTNGIDWYKRHYAGSKDGKYYAWNDGRTSFTIVDAEYPKRQKSNKRPWEYMKLYE